MDLVQITGKDMVRDVQSKAIMPVNDAERTEYYSRLNQLKVQKAEINTIRKEMDDLRTELRADIQDIKLLLLKLTENK